MYLFHCSLVPETVCGGGSSTRQVRGGMWKQNLASGSHLTPKTKSPSPIGAFTFLSQHFSISESRDSPQARAVSAFQSCVPVQNCSGHSSLSLQSTTLDIYTRTSMRLSAVGMIRARSYTTWKLGKGLRQWFTCMLNSGLLPKKGCFYWNSMRHWVKHLCWLQKVWVKKYWIYVGFSNNTCS